MEQFIFVLKGHPKNWQGTSSQDEIQIMQSFVDWVNFLAEKKNYKECTRLRPQMTTIQQSHGEISVDGPFAETKEVLSGIFWMQAENYDEAIAIAKTCPMLARGEQISVLPVWSN